MSKADDIRALREAKHKPTPMRGIKPEKKRPVKLKGKVAVISVPTPKDVGKELQVAADGVKKRLTPHPDCPVCTNRRKKTLAFMRAKRAEQ